MGKKIIFLLVLVSSMVRSQEISRSGLIKGTLTISPATLLDSKNQPFYFHGILEGYTSEKISFVGEGSFYLGDLSSNEVFRFNNSIFAGFNWHLFKDGSSDLFVGLQPGISFTMLSEQTSNDRLAVNPVSSFNLGYNYFMNEYFHFFVLGKVVLGRHSSYSYQSLNELRISAGLGFSFPTNKK